jgi:DNA topoisomerase-3
VEFTVTGKQILDPGWRVVFNKSANVLNDRQEDEEKEKDDDNILPDFVKGESGPHLPSLTEKWTQPPKYYTEATLLRAMETAGKLVDDDELRDALKENGIGRPSTRAAIIETLLKRNYIRKDRKNLYATLTGMELIRTIKEELLKSAELTGIWEKKLRLIEKNEYDTRQFIEELKQMLTEIVANVKNDAGHAITIEEIAVEKEKTEKSKTKRKTENKKQIAAGKEGAAVVFCPLCKKGSVIRGKTAYGCSEWKAGCTFRLLYENIDKNLRERDLKTIIESLNK